MGYLISELEDDAFMSDSLACIPYEYVAKKSKFSWQEIVYGISNKILSSNAAVEHAMKEFEAIDDYPDALLELASLKKGDPIHPYVDDLANAEEKEDAKSIQGKWLYLLLAWIYENKDGFTDPLQLVEQVYADFDYPESIEPFVRYMPSDEPSLGSVEKDTARLYEKWNSYLLGQSEFYEAC